MFHFLSSFFTFFLSPEHWIYLCIIAAFIIKKALWRKRLLLASLVIFLVFSNEAIFTKFANWWQVPPVTLHDSSGYSVGILLGGMAMFDKDNNGYLSEASDRFTETLLLYKRGVVKKIIISGSSYNAGEPTEAGFLKQLFLQAGVPATDLVAEEASTNTFENSSFSRRMLDSLHAQPPYVVITSAFHVRRAKKVFNKAGLQVIMYPSAYLSVNRNLTLNDYLLPKANILNKWRFIIKEIAGVWVYGLTGKA